MRRTWTNHSYQWVLAHWLYYPPSLIISNQHYQACLTITNHCYSWTNHSIDGEFLHYPYQSHWSVPSTTGGLMCWNLNHFSIITIMHLHHYHDQTSSSKSSTSLKPKNPKSIPVKFLRSRFFNSKKHKFPKSPSPNSEQKHLPQLLGVGPWPLALTPGPGPSPGFAPCARCAARSPWRVGPGVPTPRRSAGCADGAGRARTQQRRGGDHHQESMLNWWSLAGYWWIMGNDRK